MGSKKNKANKYKRGLGKHLTIASKGIGYYGVMRYNLCGISYANIASLTVLIIPQYNYGHYKSIFISGIPKLDCKV